ncbi:MAG TPA: hypothetical protein VF603_07455 [Allosphingosinicella sp.]|jgi:hypothetical protein
MSDTYTIHLVNHSTRPQTFWCFLARPEALSNDPGVFANSQVSLEVRPNAKGRNIFLIPVQYQVGAGASNHAVGAYVEVISDVTNNAALGDTWNADYVDAPPNEGPTMALDSKRQKATDIAIVSNGFDDKKNAQYQWIANQSFGIVTAAGFIGMSWSPEPAKTRTITPKLAFYVASGSFGENQLADWDDVSYESAQINAPASFDDMNECTVTYTETGGWTVTAGAPPATSALRDLAFVHTDDLLDHIALRQIGKGSVTTDRLKSVQWDSASLADDAGGLVTITGTVTVATALVGAFAYFVLSGTSFDIISTSGGTSFRFRYSGKMASQAVRDLFKAGAQLAFHGLQ